MTHPFESWPRAHRRGVLLAVIAAAVTMQVVLVLLDAPLRETGDGTVAFELAGSAERSAEIVAAWRGEGLLENAAFINGLDFLFAPLYAAAISGACVAAAGAWRRGGRQRVATVGIGVAWAASAAALLDWVENVALAVILLYEPTSPWPALALAAAIPKFAAAWAGLLFAFSGAALALTLRLRANAP